MLCIYAYQFVRVESIAEDIVQDVFMQVWDNRKNISIDQPMASLLYRYTHNRSIDYLRTLRHEDELKRRVVSVEMLEHYTAPFLFDSQEDELYLKFLTSEIESCVQALPEQCRKVFMLSRQSNLHNKEIALALAISIKTVEKHLASALARIRKHLIKKGYMNALPMMAFLLCAGVVE